MKLNLLNNLQDVLYDTVWKWKRSTDFRYNPNTNRLCIIQRSLKIFSDVWKKNANVQGCQRSIADEWEYVNICNRNPTFELGYFLFKIHHNDRLERYQYGQGRLTSKRCVMCVKSRKWVFFLYFWWLRVWRSPSFAYITVINKVA